jgi:hypothetical protein
LNFEEEEKKNIENIIEKKFFSKKKLRVYLKENFFENLKIKFS